MSRSYWGSVPFQNDRNEQQLVTRVKTLTEPSLPDRGIEEVQRRYRVDPNEMYSRWADTSQQKTEVEAIPVAAKSNQAVAQSPHPDSSTSLFEDSSSTINRLRVELLRAVDERLTDLKSNVTDSQETHLGLTSKLLLLKQEVFDLTQRLTQTEEALKTLSESQNAPAQTSTLDSMVEESKCEDNKDWSRRKLNGSIACKYCNQHFKTAKLRANHTWRVHNKRTKVLKRPKKQQQQEDPNYITNEDRCEY